MIFTKPQSIVISFKEENRKLLSSTIDTNLPSLPASWVASVVFEVLYRHGTGCYEVNEIQVMCHEILEHWYKQIETNYEEDFTGVQIVSMIQLRTTQYMQEVESKLIEWGIIVNNKCEYYLKEFINEDDAWLVHRAVGV